MEISQIEAIMKLMVAHRIEEIVVGDVKITKRVHLAKQGETDNKPDFKVPTYEQLIASTPGFAKGQTDFDRFNAMKYLGEFPEKDE
jgi:hypothetical protein